MNKLIEILFGLFFVIFTPLIALVLWIVEYIKKCYSNGCFVYKMWKHEKIKSNKN